MTQFLKPTPPATPGGAPQPPLLAKKLHAWVKGRYNIATTYHCLDMYLFFQQTTIPQ